MDKTGGSEPDSNHITLLVVAANITDREDLRGLLAPRGYQLFYAVSGAQVLADASMLQPDVILMEARLPDTDALEVCRRLQSDPHTENVPIIMLVNGADADLRSGCFAAGAKDVMSSPFEAGELLSRVSTQAQLSRYRRRFAETDPAGQDHEAEPGIPPGLNIIERVIGALSIKQEPEEILQSACEVLALAFDAPQASAWMLDDDRVRFELTAEAPAPDWLLPESGGHRRSHHPPRGISQRGEPLPIEDVSWLQEFMEARSPMGLVWVLGELHTVPGLDEDTGVESASILILPILVHDLIAGIVEISYPVPRTFSGQEVALGQRVAIALGEAIETARLHRRLQNYADFLDQALAQRTLELKGERYRTESILEALGEAVVVTSLDGKIQYVNRAAIELTGYSRDEMLGQRMRLWRSHRQTAELYTQMLDTIHTGTTWRGEVINERKDGTLYSAALTVAPYFDPRDDGRPIGFLSIQRDITPVKEAERLKDQFVSNVSHELRTPLSIITLLTGNLDTLYNKLDDEKRKKLIKDIRGHVQVLNELISSVLEISRLDGGHIPKDHQQLDLAEVVREEAEKQVPLARNKYQTLHYTGDDCLPVMGNEGQLRQTIRNLLNNAIKYTPTGGYIACECRKFADNVSGDPEWPGSGELPEGHWAAFRVADTGVGIREEDLPHLFERFYRVKSQGDIPGAGLGLSIAKELIQLHSGHIAVQSSPGEGSIFAVYLPGLE